MLEEQLKKFGLSEKEAKTYLTLLELGQTNASQIAKVSGVNRSSAYVVLEALEKKGLVQSLQSKNIQEYKAASPEKLAQISEDQLKKQEETHLLLKAILPKLKGVSIENKLAPSVQVFQGKEELIRAYEDILNYSDTELLTYTHAAKLIKYMPHLPKASLDRIKNGVKMKAINPQTVLTPVMIKLADLPGDEVLFVPPKYFNFKSDLAIYADKVVLASIDENFGLMIESQSIADAMKSQFNVTWNALLPHGRLHKY